MPLTVMQDLYDPLPSTTQPTPLKISSFQMAGKKHILISLIREIGMKVSFPV